MTLLLLPNLLGPIRHHDLFLPASVDRAVATIEGLIAESESGGRRFLSHFQTAKQASEIPIALMTQEADIDFLLEPVRKGERWGLISDAGLPCIADPGAAIVRRARQLGIVIQAFIGPSAVMLALMLSGLPGQRFHFNGYLAKDPAGRKKELFLLEKASRQHEATQIFIEAPYRNRATLEMLVSLLHESTWLCVAWDLTLPTQGVISQPVALWRKTPLPNIDKKPAMFLLYAYA